MKKRKKQRSWFDKARLIAIVVVFALGIGDALYLIFWYDEKPAPIPPRTDGVTLLMTDNTGAVARVVGGRFAGDHLDIRTERTAKGDLNGDGAIDAVLVAGVNSGGTGDFKTPSLLLNSGSSRVNTDKRSIGDRVEITGLSIDDGTITVEYLDRADGEPFSARPHIPRKKAFQLRGIRLEEVL